MAPLRRQNSQFIFQYSVPLENPGNPTRILYRSPSAPYRIRGVRPTITTIYKNIASLVHDQRRQRTKRHLSPEWGSTPGPSTGRGESTTAPSTPSPSPTPPPSPLLAPSTPVHYIRSSSRARTPDAHQLESASSALHKGKGPDRPQRNAVPITRAASRSSLHGGVPSKGASRNKRPAPPGSGISLWTRFGIKNGSATFVRRDRTSSSTDRDCVTSYYESFSLEEIHTPPDLSDDPQLEEGDVYINTVYDSGASQMWIWTKDGGKLAFWKAAREGDIREDGRTSVKPTISECLDVLDSHSSRRSDIFRSRHSGAYPFDLILHLLALLSQSHMLATHIFACFRNI